MMREAFERFKELTEIARKNPAQKKAMGQALVDAIKAVGKTKDSIREARIADRTTVDRWVKGQSVPHPIQIYRLEEYLFRPVSSGVNQRSFGSFASDLLDPRFRPVITFLLEEETNNRALTEEQLVNLLTLAEKSKGKLTETMIRIFLGME